jgi:hypothetical protein
MAARGLECTPNLRQTKQGHFALHPMAETPNRLSLGREQPPNAADRRVVVRAKRADWSAWGSSEAKDREPNEVSAPILPKPIEVRARIAQNQSQPFGPNKINNIPPKPPQKP